MFISAHETTTIEESMTNMNVQDYETETSWHFDLELVEKDKIYFKLMI